MKFLKTHPAAAVILICLCGILLRGAMILPGWLKNDITLYERPDSEFYMRAAYSLANGNGYPGSTRAPGFSVTAAMLLKSTGSPFAICLLFAVLGGLSCFLVYLAGKEYANHRTGCLASLLYALNLTAICNAPMLLTDTFFGFFTALGFWLFIKFHRQNRLIYFFLCVATAALGALIRPINMLWILPALTLLLLNHTGSLKRKLLAGAAAFLLFSAILTPWMARNALRGAGFCIDVNTGAMLHQNGAMLLAEVKKSDFETEKAIILRDLDQKFSDKTRFPDEKSRVDYRKKQYTALILKHPFIWLKQQFQWKILLPDAPTFFEILNVTSPGRGTMGVLAKDGVWAAVNYYFDGKLWLPCLLLPILFITGITYAGCLGILLKDLIKIKTCYTEILLFLAFAEYYLFLPGAITAPRYQIPALPVITLFAAMGILQTAARFKKKKEMAQREAE